ncbi:MAG TPA: hypothetical protein VFW56_11910 [Bradyrhizobium sp.]|nr:hypothetical protein [Bradyrhizobium sp.]
MTRLLSASKAALAAFFVACVMLCGTAKAQSQYPCPQVIEPRIVASSNYTITTPDNCWLVTLTAAGNVNINLPAPGLIFPPGFTTSILPLNGASINLAGLPDDAGKMHLVNGLSSLALAPGSGVILKVQEDYNWYAMPTGSANGLVIGKSTLIYPASSFCPAGQVFDGSPSHDVGQCIQAAINAVAASIAFGYGGGTVVIPAGLYYFATPFGVSLSGIKIVSAGAQRDDGGSTMPGRTVLTYNGPSGAGPGFWIDPLNTTTELANVDATGFSVDCQSLLQTCGRIVMVEDSDIVLGFASGTKTTEFLGANAATQSHTLIGVQQNHRIALYARCLDNAQSPTCIMLGQDSGGSTNVSLNTNISLDVDYNGNGDGIVIAAADTDLITSMRVKAPQGLNSTAGSPCVLATPNYTMPNGLKPSGFARSIEIDQLHCPLWVQGLNTGATFAAGGGNTGGASLRTVTIPTTAPTAAGGLSLTFADTTGILAGMDLVGCGGGGVTSGVYPHTLVRGGGTSTTVVIQDGATNGDAFNGIASGVNCTFASRVTSSAKHGTYTFTYNSGTGNFDVTPAPGGTTESVPLSGGGVNGTDFFLAINGTPNNGDTFTMVVPANPSRDNWVRTLDNENNVSFPHAEAGVAPIVGFRNANVAHASGAVCLVAGATDSDVANGFVRSTTKTATGDLKGLSTGCLAGVSFFSGNNRPMAVFDNGFTSSDGSTPRMAIRMDRNQHIVYGQRLGTDSSGFAWPEVAVATQDKTISTAGSDVSMYANGRGADPVTIPANMMTEKGRVIEERIAGWYTTPSGSTATVTPKVWFGGNAIVSGAATQLPANVANAPFWLDVVCTVRGTGASGSGGLITCAGSMDYLASGTSGARTTINLGTVSAVAIDTTVDNVVDCTWRWTGTLSTQTAEITDAHLMAR